MNNVNKAKFFCENCGSEVPENAKVCKKCGKFFISVRCPKCGATGSSKDFEDGCPKCGYAVSKTKKNTKQNISSSFSEDSLQQKSTVLERLFSAARAQAHSNKPIKNENSLPLWIYIFTGIMLVVVMFAVYSCIKTPL